jgi:hypothetical protein
MGDKDTRLRRRSIASTSRAPTIRWDSGIEIFDFWPFFGPTVAFAVHPQENNQQSLAD